jgi:hypothetical protein
MTDLAQHYLLKANITALRRVRKSDNNRIARAVGATIVNRIEDLRDTDVGTRCGMFYIEKLGDESVPSHPPNLSINSPAGTLHSSPNAQPQKHARSSSAAPPKTSSTKSTGT